jgi:hypothetical protein
MACQPVSQLRSFLFTAGDQLRHQRTPQNHIRRRGIVRAERQPVIVGKPHLQGITTFTLRIELYQAIKPVVPR